MLYRILPWIKGNKLRITLVAVSISLALLYVFKLRNPGTPANNPNYFGILGLRWLEASVIVSLIISGVAFFMAFFREKPWSELTKLQKGGVGTGFFLYSSLLGLCIIQFTDKAIDFDLLLLALVIIALFMGIADALLGLGKQMVELDFIVFGALLLICVIPYGFSSTVRESDFMVGFHSGAAAFQLILANCAFDPKLYQKVFQ